ncbi:phage portal protein [Clostridium swellfunianum]|uniref:phage portal protein n=1 Tax=Clostridium swellfunianum TaxID=1367462 RepID=UPI00202E9BE1|nr:phage portal protein [Clostridium swellfunianum]MCM0648646.1 phage portal protein [Clostridium swellfunianum]
MSDVKETLLKLSDAEKKERLRVKSDYHFYKGKCEDGKAAKQDKSLLGQSWESNDNVDYTPTQDIRNKVKPLLKKQARFMFGNEPFINFKPNNMNDSNKCEELRKFIDDVLEANKFWNNTRKAFLMSTIKKRVLLRVEANPGMPIIIKYENIEDFYYKEQNGILLEARFFEEDEANAFTEADKDKIYYIHVYCYDKPEDSKEVVAFYKQLTYKGDDLINPTEVKAQPTGFSRIPCWLIKNGGELGDSFGESDVDELRELQNQYNRKNSDFADALKFQMFGAESIIDGNPDDVNKLTIAPNAVHAIRTDDNAANNNKQAVIQRLEYNMGNAEAANSYLDRLDHDMKDILDMPDIKDLSNIPSAKAMKYMYNDLIGRCEEKWNDWEPVLKELINFIIEAAPYCYKNKFKNEWSNLAYTLIFTHNYPLPADEEDKKKTAMDEVITKVRSIRSYIKEFTDEEDAEKSLNEILEEITLIASAESEQPQLNTGGSNE